MINSYILTIKHLFLFSYCKERDVDKLAGAEWVNNTRFKIDTNIVIFKKTSKSTDFSQENDEWSCYEL